VDHREPALVSGPNAQKANFDLGGIADMAGFVADSTRE
jgi:hypothetical protein